MTVPSRGPTGTDNASVSEALVAPTQVQGVRRVKERRPLAIFASSGDDERRRRPADVFAFWFGIVVVLASAIERNNPTPTFHELTQFLQSVPDWVQTLVGGLMAVAAIYVVVVFLLAVVAADRRGLVRDMLVGALVAVPAVMITEWIVEGSWPTLRATFDGDGPQFPVTRVVFVSALVLIANPHVIKPIRRLGNLAVTATVVGAIALGFGDTAQAFGAFGLGLAIAAAVHLALRLASRCAVALPRARGARARRGRRRAPAAGSSRSRTGLSSCTRKTPMATSSSSRSMAVTRLTPSCCRRSGGSSGTATVVR